MSPLCSSICIVSRIPVKYVRRALDSIDNSCCSVCASEVLAKKFSISLIPLMTLSGITVSCSSRNSFKSFTSSCKGSLIVSLWSTTLTGYLTIPIHYISINRLISPVSSSISASVTSPLLMKLTSMSPLVSSISTATSDRIILLSSIAPGASLSTVTA